MKKSALCLLLTLITLLFISCGGEDKSSPGEQNLSDAALTQPASPLISPGDIDIDPNEPILSDSEILMDRGIAEADLSALTAAEADARSDRQVDLKASVDYSTMTTNYFSTEDMDPAALRSSESAGPLKIVDYGPSGVLPIEMRRPTVYVQFNQPMVPISKLGEPLRESSILSIEPPVEGVYRWYGTKTLSFEPDGPMHRQRAYRISIDKESKSVFGRTLGLPFDFVIESEPLDIVSLAFGPADDLYDSQTEVPPTHCNRIVLSFNQTVDLEGMKEYLSLTPEGAENTPLAFSLSRPDKEEYGWQENRLMRSVLIRVEDEMKTESGYILSLSPGYRAAGDASPLEAAIAREIRTVGPFVYDDHSRYSYSFPWEPEGVMNPVYLDFSHPVDPDTVTGNMSVSFDGIDLKDHTKVYGSTVRVANLPVEYESSYQLTLSRGIRDIYGRELELEADEVVEVDVPAAVSYSVFPGYDGLNTLESEFQPALIYQYQNIDEGSFAINGEEQELALDKAERNRANFRLVDLKPYLNGEGFGSVDLSWAFKEEYRDWKNRLKERIRERDMTVQVTDLGITVRYAYNRILVWVNSISGGEAVGGATVTVQGMTGSLEGRTDGSGLAQFELEDGQFHSMFYNRKRWGYSINLRAEMGSDRADLAVANTQYAGRFGIWSESPLEAEDSLPRTFLFTDRGIYKPGEILTYRGVDWNQRLGVFTPFEGSHKLSILENKGWDKKLVRSWNGSSSASGGFFDQVELAEDLPPGSYTLRYERGKSRKDIPFQVAHFRRLNFQVELKRPDRSFILGDTVSVPLEASYLSGGTMGGEELYYYWTRKPVDFRPAGNRWDSWVFGPRVWGHESTIASEEAKLSVQGRADMEVPTKDHRLTGKAYRYVVEATVTDIDRQAVSAATSVVVHPASWYIGARTGESSDSGWWRRFVPVDKEILFSLAQVDTEGKRRNEAGELELEMIKGSYKAVQQKNVGSRINTRYEWVEESLLKETVPWREGAAEFRYTPESSGSYRLRMTGRDRQGREIVTDLGFYASGGSWVRWAGENMEDITLEPEKELYFPGETARILVKSPLEKGRYLMTIEREGILEERFVDLDPADPILEIPVKEEWVPVMYITLSSFMPRTAVPESYEEPDFGKPKGIFGAAALNISTASRELDLEVTADRAVYRPGEKARVKIRVSDQGRPVPGAELTYLAVDRGVLDLINYHIPNPLDYFYDRNSFLHYGGGDDSRRLLLAPVTYETSNLQGGDGEDSKLERRENFTPLAVFEPFLLTDEKGEAELEIDWPDNLTTYRSTAIVLAGQKIGYSENELYVRNPLNVRAALPRQMRVRDTSFAGVVITNIDEKDHDVTVRIDSEGLGLPGENEKTVTVPAGESYEVPFVLEAREAGEAQIVFTVLSNVLNEELVKTLTVEAPLVTESMRSTGIVSAEESSAEELLLIPSLIGERYGSLRISLDSSQAPFLRRQFEDLSGHRDYDFTFDHLYRAAPGIMAPELVELMDPALAKEQSARRRILLKVLAERQMEDGGICSSQRSYALQSNPYASLLAYHMLILLMQREPGMETGADLEALRAYLGDYAYGGGSLYFRLYFHYLKTLSGTMDEALTDSYLEKGDELGLSGTALMGIVCHLEGRQEKARELYGRVKNFVSIGTRGVDIRETYEARWYFDSGYQQLSQLLRLALVCGEGPEMLRRYSYSLDRSRGERNWINSQDRLWMALALSDLLAREEGGETSFDSRVILKKQPLISESFRGFSEGARSSEFSLYEDVIPISGLNEPASLLFEKEGTGSLFYTSTLDYALPNEVAPSRDEGISVVTQIETLEGDRIEGDTLELGGTYRMRVFLNTSKTRGYVNLRVPVPSGVEIVDPSFAVSSSYFNRGGVQSESWKRESLYGDEETILEEGYIWRGYRFPFRPNQRIYNNEIRYSWDYLYYGTREVSFVFRCTTPGIYPTPPTTADLLFEPEVFGRDKGRLIIVK